MRLYFVLYHEATLANFLEVLLYHGHVCEQAGDLLIEVADYCARKMTMLISGWVLAVDICGRWIRASQSERWVDCRPHMCFSVSRLFSLIVHERGALSLRKLEHLLIA